MNNFKPKSRFVLEEMTNGANGQIPKTSRDEAVVFDTPHITIEETYSILVPRHCERAIKALDQLNLLGETYEVIP